jgi:diguanylate cyclase (GGDEF)-like protein/putative nucleotidyltransferase with HDIG domain
MTQRRTALSLPGRLYVAVVVIAGTAAVVESFYDLLVHPVDYRWALLAVFTLVSGSATVRLPSVQATISVSETFVFTSVLLFGAAAGTITVALDALVMSFWVARRKPELHRLLFNMAAPPLSIWIAANVFFLVADVPPYVDQKKLVEIGSVVLPLILFTIVYFLLNSWLIALAIKFEQGEQALRIWRDNLLWLSLNYFGGASVAALLVGSTVLSGSKQSLNITLLLFVPLLLVLYFTFKTAFGRVEDANNHLERVNQLYLSTIETLAMAIDAKDQITHGHIRRVQIYAVELAKAVGIKESNTLRAVEAAALLHDMGKLAVPEYILNKPGPLTPAEFDKMKLHASVGADILSSIDFPYPVVPMVRHHHENWDGTGYPAGLSGTDIPIGARILAVVDCFDALTSDRPYRPRLSDEEAMKILSERRGRMYDPLVVDRFISLQPTISVVADDTSGDRALVAIAEAAVPGAVPNEPSALEDISSSVGETMALYDLARDLTGKHEPSDIVSSLATHLRRLIPASWYVLYCYSSESDELVATYASGDGADLSIGLRIPLGQRSSGWVAANRQSIVNSDPVLDLGEIARFARPRLRSCIGSAVLADDRLVGVLALYSSTQAAFSEQHKRVLEIVTKQISRPLEQALGSRIQGPGSLRDSATGLPNLEQIQQLISSDLTGKSRGALTLLLIGVHGAPGMHQQQGRSAGDRAVSKIVESAGEILRNGDLLFSYGTQEFVALLPQTDSNAGRTIANRILSVVQTHVLSTNANSGISVSIGIASAPADGTSFDALLLIARTDAVSQGRLGASRPDSIH